MSDRSPAETEPAASPTHSLIDILRGCTVLLLVGVLLATAAAWLGRVHWVFDLFTHWRPAYLLLSAMCLLLLLVLRARLTWSVAALLAVIIHAWAVVPWYLPVDRHGAAATEAVGQHLVVVVANVYTANEDHAAVLAMLDREQPDLFAVMEVNQRWVRALGAIHDRYPHRVVEPRADNFGIAVYSRLPLRDAQVMQLGPVGVPSIVARVEWPEGKPVHLVVTHPLPPMSADNFEARNAQLAAVGQWVLTQRSQAGGEHLILGDLNATMWSPWYEAMRDATGSVNARRGFGIQGTWPSGGLTALRIPIDHALVSLGIGVIDCRALPTVGSDHLPLRLVVSVPGLY
jgi:endonuclease/exonuclease/phosphatase (EEP) superfamily protein YafD